MPKVIELLADEGSSLDQTLRRALQTLQDQGIKTLAAGQIFSGDNQPIGRILLCDPSDKERSIKILSSVKIYVCMRQAGTNSCEARIRPGRQLKTFPTLLRDYEPTTPFANMMRSWRQALAQKVRGCGKNS
jgi:hypothetical protein